MMKVALLDLKAQFNPIRDEIRAAIDEVIESQHFIMGPVVTALEEELAQFCETKHVIGCSSGTDALLMALMALDVRPGDEILTTPYSFFATAGVIARLGAVPVFVDINPSTFNVDVDAAIAAMSSRTKAIMPVHLFGQVVEMSGLVEAARNRGIAVVEDAAQAIGARDSRGKQAGSFGDISCFSFFPSKNLGAFGDGGMVSTNDDALADKLKLLRVHGSRPKYHHAIVGGNFRLDALQAAVLRVKLKYLVSWTAARRKNAQHYRDMTAASDLMKIIKTPNDAPGHIYNQFVIRAPQRDALQQYLSSCGIGTEIYYPVPLHLQECFTHLGYERGSLPEAERAARETLALPIYPELTVEQIACVVGTIQRFYQQTRQADVELAAQTF